jgi:transcriptional regulator with XRE-family HTH domain
MTPFGERVRQLRRERNLMLKDMASHLGVSSAYLSALERGERGKPTWTLIQGVLQYFRIIWDEADELTRLSPGKSLTSPAPDAKAPRLFTNPVAYVPDPHRRPHPRQRHR